MPPLDRFAGGPPLGGAPRLALCFASRLSRIFSLALRPACGTNRSALGLHRGALSTSGREARHSQRGSQTSRECLLRRTPALLEPLIRCVAI